MDARAAALDEQLKDYIAEWRAQRTKEEEELKQMKEKQANRKVGLLSYFFFSLNVIL